MGFIQEIIYLNNGCDISFGVEHILKEIRQFIENKNIVRNIYRIQAYDSVIWGYFCI